MDILYIYLSSLNERFDYMLNYKKLTRKRGLPNYFEIRYTKQLMVKDVHPPSVHKLNFVHNNN